MPDGQLGQASASALREKQKYANPQVTGVVRGRTRPEPHCVPGHEVRGLGVEGNGRAVGGDRRGKAVALPCFPAEERLAWARRRRGIGRHETRRTRNPRIAPVASETYSKAPPRRTRNPRMAPVASETYAKAPPRGSRPRPPPPTGTWADPPAPVEATAIESPEPSVTTASRGRLLSPGVGQAGRRRGGEVQGFRL